MRIIYSDQLFEKLGGRGQASFPSSLPSLFNEGGWAVPRGPIALGRTAFLLGGREGLRPIQYLDPLLPS